MPPPLPSRRPHRGVLEERLGGAEPPPAAPTPAPEGVAASPDAAAPAAPPATAFTRFTTRVPSSLVERLRTAVFFTPGLTLSGLAVEALEREIERLEAVRGEPFPAGRGRLRTGRPIR
ncbi:MAG TPA: hypothetical protein VJA16_14855 [Thermoanaerobaculia bacterium]